MNKLTTLLLLTLLFNCYWLHAQYSNSDSIPRKTFWNSTTFRLGAVPAGLIAAGLGTWGERKNIREFRNRYIPEFRHHYDDYLQYLPVLTVIGLNTAGIHGRSKPKRAFVSYAFSAGIMGIVVNSIKYSAKVERPSGDERNSFPSGHTANAFMNATFLHKEYGQYRHPLFSVGAYTIATATAFGRQLNNRHWISDVLVGAGLGILSTELGYFFADKVFGDKGLAPAYRQNDLVPVNGKPSFLEIRLSFATILHKDLTSFEKQVSARHGFNMGVEGAWFFHKNFGVGGEFSFSSFPMNADKLNANDPDFQELTDGTYVQPMGVRNLLFGPFFSVPLPGNWFITGKLTAGSAVGAQGFIVAKLKEQYQEVFEVNEIDYLRYKPESTFSWGTGIGLQKRLARNIGISGYVNYYSSQHDFDIDEVTDIDPDGKYVYGNTTTHRIDFDHLTFGVGLTAYLW